LLDEAVFADGTVDVDLNPIRAAMSGSPETRQFTSVNERLRRVVQAWP